uniref:G-protein coupled receptors family 1 profile domain-containing protein n=1 Tax=Romanomermis culicivorax TaxID=13658 RepID=A0A915IUW8_ROMCU
METPKNATSRVAQAALSRQPVTGPSQKSSVRRPSTVVDTVNFSDRIFLEQLFKYYKTKHTEDVMPFSGIYLFGTLLSISDVFRYNVVFDPISETFIVSEDEQYISKLLPKILVAVRSCSRIVIIFIVIVVNVMILIKYHFVSTKRKKLTVSVSSDQGKTRQNSSRDQAALAAMLFVQTILMVIGHVPMSVSYILIYVDSENSSSSGRRYFNMFVNVAFCAEMACIFVVLLLTNRKLASSLLKCCGSKEDTSVTMAMASKMK